MPGDPAGRSLEILVAHFGLNNFDDFSWRFEDRGSLKAAADELCRIYRYIVGEDAHASLAQTRISSRDNFPSYKAK